jgi:hypothetical protein
MVSGSMMIQIGLEPAHGVYNSGTEQWDDGTDGPVSDAQWAVMLRRERDRRLGTSDWTQAADSPLTDSKKAEWAAYRTALRDLPASAILGMVVDFPDPPEGA